MNSDAARRTSPTRCVISRRWLSPVLALFCLAGCGHKPKSRVYAVEGKLLVGDAPAANASVAFHPLDRKSSSACPVATTGPDGSYRLTTYAAADGAPAGEYVVTVIWRDDSNPFDECTCHDPAAHDRLFGVFADSAASSLRATVRPEQNHITVQVPDIRKVFDKRPSSPR